MEYDVFQQEAIEAYGGYHLILAPPGCGKTDILSRRIEVAHQMGVPYSEMLCLTFTNRASKGMQERVSRNTGEPVPADLFIGNVHRFCAQFLFENNIIPQNTAIIDDFDFDSIIRDLATTMVDDVWGQQVSPHGVVNLQHAIWQKCHGVKEDEMLHGESFDDVRKAFAELSEMSGYDYQGVYDHIEELWVKVEDYLLSEAVRLIRLSHRYQMYKEENDMLDFDDLLVRTYDTVHQLKEWRRYNWIQIDEVQDLSPAQLAIIDIFTGDEPTVVYLGDEQQAIFSFIGAKMETLEMLKHRCKEHIHRLYKNYRSPRYLLDVLNAYAVQQLNIDPSLLPTTDNQSESSKGDLYVMQANNINEEYRQVVQQAIGYSKKESGKIAVIVPYNMHADRVSEAFLAASVPHFKISGTDLFATPTIQALFAHLSIAQNEGGFTSWAKLLFHTGMIKRYTDARNFMREMRKDGMLPTDFIRYDESSYMQQFVKAYDEREIVIFDTETTGLDVFEDEIIQIAAVKVRGSELVQGSEFNCFLEINKEIPPVLKGDKVNPMVEQYAQHPHEKRSEGLMKFIEYCKGCVLVGHNVEYDYHILYYNLKRDCPEVDLRSLLPEYYDTLKYIRLVEPRLRFYSLEKLLVQLHLEGCNSHMADDDIMATKALLDYCREHSEERLQRQQRFWKTPTLANAARKIKRCYTECYQHTQGVLYELQKDHGETPLLVQELQTIYDMMLEDKLVAVCDKWHYVVDYLTEDVINPIAYDSLKDQLAHYNGDLMTCREADLCGSRSMKEQFFVSTVHKAKGLEFESVIIVEANADKYPHHLSTTMEAMQEDARKFYVALSRAKKRLCILCTQHPTPFLECIKNQFYMYHQEGSHWQLQQEPFQPEGNTPYAIYRNGARMRQLGKTEEALNYFRKALEMDGNCRDAACQIADIYFTKGDEMKAMEALSLVQQSAKRIDEPQPFSLDVVIPTELIASQVSLQQTLEPSVGYQVNPCFAQKEIYPLVTLSQVGVPLLLPRNKRSHVRGYKDGAFYQYLKQHIIGVQFSNNCHIVVPYNERVLEPAMALLSMDIGLLIDVEIDAPYDRMYRYPTHYEEDNWEWQRDKWLSENGWIVVRFSERQVHLQTHECMLLLQDIINSAHHGYVARHAALTGEKRWNKIQSVRWEQALYREHYLGIEAFPPYDYSLRVVAHEQDEPSELVFNEVNHTYAPESNQTGLANYISVTTLIDQFFSFDTERYLIRKAEKENRPLAEVCEEFELLQQDASNRGTDLHADIEHFLKGDTIANNSVEYGYFQQFYQDKIIPGMEFVDAEKMVFLPEWNVAGMVDALFRRKRDGAYVMVDWKRSTHLIIDDGHVKKYGAGRGLSILGHLDASSYYKYELQQSFYKYILSQRYGIEVEAMMLCVLHPDYPRYYTIRLENYREREIKAILQTLNRIQ